MSRAFVTIGFVVALTYATRSFIPQGMTVTGSGAALALGFLLIVAVQAGYICDQLKMPRFNFRMDDGLKDEIPTRAAVAGMGLRLVDEPIKQPGLY